MSAECRKIANNIGVSGPQWVRRVSLWSNIKTHLHLQFWPPWTSHSLFTRKFTLICEVSKGTKKSWLHLEWGKWQRATVLEITVGHQTLLDQISRMSCQFHIMIRHDDRTSHQHILSYLLQGVSQWFLSGLICKMANQKEDMKGHVLWIIPALSCRWGGGECSGIEDSQLSTYCNREREGF